MYSVTGAGAKRAGAALVPSGTCSITGAGAKKGDVKKGRQKLKRFHNDLQLGRQLVYGVGAVVAAQVAASAYAV